MNDEVPVLDQGYVKLVSHMGDDLTPLEAARMSTDTETGVDTKKDDSLRKRLWRLEHSSPFEMNEACFELMIPMFGLRQIDRHRTIAVSNHFRQVEGGLVEEIFHPEETVDYDEFRKFTSRNEFSGRYSVMPDIYYEPPLERIKGKSATNKQGSGDGLDEEARKRVQLIIKNTTDLTRQAYEAILEEGVASELARIVLPQSQYTKIRIKACLLNWFKFLKLRLPHEAQEETRMYAQAIARGLRRLWPASFEVFEEYTLYASRLSRTETRVLQEALAYFGTRSAFEGFLKESTLSRSERREMLRKVWPEEAPEPLV